MKQLERSPKNSGQNRLQVWQAAATVWSLFIDKKSPSEDIVENIVHIWRMPNVDM